MEIFCSRKFFSPSRPSPPADEEPQYRALAPLDSSLLYLFAKADDQDTDEPELDEAREPLALRTEAARARFISFLSLPLSLSLSLSVFFGERRSEQRA
jgi:hypothetical protein